MKEVVQSILAGDKEAFREIVREYAPGVRAFIASSISDPLTVDDLTQETFIATYQSLERVDLEIGLGGWIKSIAKNKLRMHLRSYYRKHEVIQSLHSDIMVQVIADIEDHSEEEKEQIDTLRNCIEKLPERSRDIVKKRYMGNETVINLAEKLQSTVTAISSLLYRVKQQLKDCMEGAIGVYE